MLFRFILAILIASIEHNNGKFTLPSTLTSKQINVDLKSSDGAQSPLNSNAKNGTEKWLFKDYMKKYRPINVWERLHKKRKGQGRNVSLEGDFDNLFDAMDSTDDLLSIKMPIIPKSGRRKWFPPGTLSRNKWDKDLFSLRHRIFELIVHAIYWTRNKLIIMQNFRKKYRDSKIYKMGFITSKADTTCGVFHKFAYRALHACIGARYYHLADFPPIEMLHAEERLNHKWFDIELLIDIITENYNSCLEMLEKADKNKQDAWKFND